MAAVLFFSSPSRIAVSPETVYAAGPQATPTVAEAMVYAPEMCNCYAYVKSQIPDFPRTADLENNTTPHAGAVAIFDYYGTPHYGIIDRINADGFWLRDSNFGGCGLRTHYIEWTDTHIRGFWAE